MKVLFVCLCVACFCCLTFDGVWGVGFGFLGCFGWLLVLFVCFAD